jgi:Fe2+ or Zn2+ uptake regulation protein
MTASPEYRSQLHSLGCRVTRQRLAILHVLRDAPGHLSPGQVFARARREVPGLTPTTVYRTLEFLRTHGFVWQSSRDRGHLAYELAHDRHHHLTCLRCGRETALPTAEVERAYGRLEAVSGYTIDHEHVTLSGLCPKCQAEPPGV